MTHLRIQQSDSAIEQVSSAVISKLYELATSRDLDQTSDLVGRLHTTATYQEYIDAIRAEYSGLYITSDKYYVHFADSEANRILKDVYVSQDMQTIYLGDGIGVIQTYFSLPRLFPNGWFNGNTVLQSFNELSKMTACTEIYASAFKECTNLRSVNLQNIRTIGTAAFQNCTSLKSLGNVNNLENLGTRVFEGCDITGTLVLPSIKTVGSLAFYNNPNLQVIDFGQSLTYLNWQSVWSCADNLKMIFRSTTPVQVDGNDTRLYNRNFTIYIPDGCKNDYIQEAHFAANSNKIHFISELTQSS